MSLTDVDLNRRLPVKSVTFYYIAQGGILIVSIQAAVAWEAGKDLSIEEIEVAPPKAHEVRIEIYYTGVCHTGVLESMPIRACHAKEPKMRIHYLVKIQREHFLSSLVMRVQESSNRLAKG